MFLNFIVHLIEALFLVKLASEVAGLGDTLPLPSLPYPPYFILLARCFLFGPLVVLYFFLKLSAMDVLARTPMKGAAKCDEHCELQNSENQ